MVFAPEVDLTNRLIAIALFVSLLVASFGFGAGLYRARFARRIADRRWRRAGIELEDAGFRVATPEEIDHTARLPVHLLSPEVLGERRGGGIERLWIGSVNDRQVRVFNARVRAGGWVDRPAAAMETPTSFAITSIWPAKRGIRPRPGMQRRSSSTSPSTAGWWCTPPILTSPLR